MRRILTAFLLAFCVSAAAQEQKKETAVITALDPASLVSGTPATLKIRGLRLKEATEIKFPNAPGLKANIKEKKDAGQTNGIENKFAGDTQLLVELTLPAGLPSGILDFTVVTPAGEASGKIPVIPPAAAVEEKEPNNGFPEPQPLEPGKFIRGAIQGEKDVDVYSLTAKAGQKLKITVTGGSAVLMDPSLNCYDARGGFLAACDDTEARDPALTLTATADGPVLICVSDAHDKGGEWHSYLLTAQEAK